MLQFSNQSTGETRQQAILHTLQINRRTVGSQNNLLAQTEQVVEDMEERVKRLRCCSPLLDIINNEHINRLIELDEFVYLILTYSIRKLHLEQTGRHIEHTLLRIHLLTTHANSINQVRLTTTRRSEDKERIES